MAPLVNSTLIQRMERNVLTYKLTGLSPNTDYKFISQLQVGFSKEYNRPTYINITCLAYNKDGTYNNDICVQEDQPNVPN